MEFKDQYPVLMNAPFGFAAYQVVYNDDGKPLECRFLQINKVFENITGLKGKNVIGKTLKEVMPGFLDDQFDWISNFAEIAEKCTAKTFERYSNSLGKWLKVHVSAVKKGYLELYIDEISREHHFAQAVKELTEFTYQNIDYRKIANWMREISGAEYVVCNKFDKEGKSFTTVGLSGISANIERAVKILGFQLEGKKWDYDPFRERQIKEAKVTRFNSLGELTSRVFSKPLIKLIETTFYIGEMVLVKSTKDDKLVGDFTLIYGRNRHLQNTAIVESFADITGSTMARIDAEKALAESETKYRMIAENSSDVIWLIGLDLQFLYVSPSTTRLFGYSLEEREKGEISLMNLLLPEEFDKLKLVLASEIEEYKKSGNKRSIIFETIGNHKNGNLIFLEVSARFVFDENGMVKAVQGTTRDISERKKYEKELLSVKEEIEISEKKHRQLLNNLHAAVVVHSPDTHIIFCNQKASELLGISTNNFGQIDAYSSDWYFLDGIGNKLSTDNYPVVEVLRTGNAVENQSYGIIHNDGSLIWVQVNAYPEFDALNQLKQVVVTFIDITTLKETEKQLFESEARFKALHNASFGGLAIHDNGIILDCNLGLSEMTGFTVDELVGMNGLMLVAEQSREMVMQNIISGIEYPYEAFGLRKDGTMYPLRIEARNIPYKGKQVRSVEFRDITTQKNYETELIIAREKAEEITRKILEKQAIIDAVIHNIPFDIWARDKHQVCFLQNKISKEVWGNLLGNTPFTQNIPEDTREVWINNNNQVLSGQIINAEIEFSDAFGKQRYMQNIIAPIVREDEILGMVGINIDIAERKKHEHELLIAKEKAEESDRLKSAFLANMSHEIRTPMNGILGFTSLLNSPGLSGEDRNKYIGIIEESGQRMLSTVNDLIDISKIETGQVSLYYSSTNIQERINAIYEFFKPEAEAKNLAFQLKIELAENETELETDTSKFDSILTNLVKNAIKFTNKGLIEIGCQWITQPDADASQQYISNSILVSVKDTGIGIPASRLTKIFNRFEQVETEDTRFYEGAGLGLTIAKAYTEMLSGKLWLESEENKGSVFYFNLPVLRVKQLKTKLKEKVISLDEHKTKAQQLTILIAEDDETGFLYLDAILKPTGAKIIRCETGICAVQKCFQYPEINLVLMDIRMPEMNGIEAIKKIREFNKKIIIIAQTAYALPGEKQRVIDAGCNEYISKPINKAELLEKISKLIHQK